MYNLANASIYFYSIQRGTPHVNLRQKRASLFNSQILVVALIGIFGGLKPKMCVHFSKDWRSVCSRACPKLNPIRPLLPGTVGASTHPLSGKRDGTPILRALRIRDGISSFQVCRIHLHTFLQYSPDPWLSHTCSGISRYRDTLPNSP